MGTRVVESDFGSVELRSQRVKYGAAAIAGRSAEESGSLFLVIVREGQAELLSGDVRLSLTSNEGAFVPGAAFMVQSNNALVPYADLLFVRAPLVLANDLQGFDETTSMLQVPPGSLLLQPILAFAAALNNEKVRQASALEKYYAERLVHEMLLSLLVRTSITLPEAAHRDYFSRAMTVIASQCTDAALTGAAVATEVSLSLRQLERVFAQNGMTLGRTIRLARIENAKTLLSDNTYDALTMTQVAQLSGFSNGSSLTRAMAAEGYPAPTEIRRREIN